MSPAQKQLLRIKAERSKMRCLTHPEENIKEDGKES